MSHHFHQESSEQDVLSHLAEIVSIADLGKLLDVVVTKTVDLVGGAGCSVYLIPRLVSQYDGRLVDENMQTVSYEDLDLDSFVVLAATSRKQMEEYIGRAFYPPEEGFTSWVFSKGQTLCLSDSSDEQELSGVDPHLRWGDRYGGAKNYYPDDSKPKPILIVPIRAGNRTIGVLKIPASRNSKPFSASTRKLVETVGRVIGSTIQQNHVIHGQRQLMLQLVEMAAKPTPNEGLTSMVSGLGDMLRIRHCRLYLLDSSGSCVQLWIEHDRVVSQEDQTDSYCPGEGLVGWILMTGKPLIINDQHEFLEEQDLDDIRLENISDGPAINSADRRLCCRRKGEIDSTQRSVPFLGVPVKADDQSVQGVICANGLNERPVRTSPFSQSDLDLTRSFARVIALVLQNKRNRELNSLLLKYGYETELSGQIDLTVRAVGNLVNGANAYIFGLSAQRELLLQDSNLLGEGLTSPPIMVNYKIGEGKTGFVARHKSTLVVNHYGHGEEDQKAIDSEIRRMQSAYQDDLLADLHDDEDRRVGIIQLRHSMQLGGSVQEDFRTLVAECKLLGEDGLPSRYRDAYRKLGGSTPWSFVAVPIMGEAGELQGVLTMERALKRRPFTPQDVNLLESVASRLGSVWHNRRLQEQRISDFLSLAHELHTPLTGLIADAENLISELQQADPDVLAQAQHSHEQVLRLQLQTETIMAVLANQIPRREFALDSVADVLQDAIVMFQSEARQKECEILLPNAAIQSFPLIEMSYFDLAIAFKNVIHNAVKYSYRPPKGRTQQRYIRILGSRTSSNSVVIHIQNYGVGVSQEEIKNRLVFQSFYRGTLASDHRRTGAGLGMAHARQIVEDLHHGTIDMTSRMVPGGAYLTTVIVTLPIKQPAEWSY